MADTSGKDTVGSVYDSLSRTQLLALLRKRDNERRLGLVWERNEIDPDNAIDNNFVVADLIADQCERVAPWDNLVIEGDNFDALRWLRMSYRGRIKCIYIDPPYNTGNKDWVYNDDYVDPNHRYRQSQWLEFLFRRLIIARDLLTPDGVLLCSINDDNRAKLELMMEQALPGMRVGSVTWRSRTGGNDSKGAFLSPNHEHVLVFANPQFAFSGSPKALTDYTNPDGDVRGDWQSDNLSKAHDYRQRPNGFYPLRDPDTDIYYPCNPDNVWRYSSMEYGSLSRVKTQHMEEWIRDRQILFPTEQRTATFSSVKELRAAIKLGDVPTSGNAPLLREALPPIRLKDGREIPFMEFWVGKKIGFGTPRFKRFAKDLRNPTQPLSSWVTPNAEANTLPEGVNAIVSGTNDEAAKVIKEVFGEKAFQFAKPVSLIRELVRQTTGPRDTVLDFFAGSATTAQAVMEVNAEDEGSRRFIMVSSTEATKDDPNKNICRDVTAERIRRLNTNAKSYAELSAGFAYLRCREINPLEIDDALTPQTAWSILQAYHGLALTVWPEGGNIADHAGEQITLVLVDGWDSAAAAKLQRIIGQGRPVFVYAFAPGQIGGLDDTPNVEIYGVQDTLQRMFAA